MTHLRPTRLSAMRPLPALLLALAALVCTAAACSPADATFDGCNWCICNTEGEWSCSEKQCSTPSPDDTRNIDRVT
ncbi:serine protease inhibitor 3-like [Schistocerca serialis cubense]|uniref:serine protease inhibitor 3-like n=1 Tax=Schistocerca serialis cubense TaxID=2023355 RepID=UPI00214F4075|nr:serine protease inhibitor 3-like [Schistocerca serialis cubense]